MEAKCNSDFGFSLNGFDFDEEIEVWIDSFYNLSESKSKKKIFVQIEPNEILKKNKEIIKNHNIFDFVTLKQDLESLGFVDVEFWDWKYSEHNLYDDFSQAYLPHMDKENGVLMSLNIQAKKNN